MVFVSKEHLYPMSYRVERKANLADGPTRPDDVTVRYFVSRRY